jgi:hypothetical protein
MSQLRSVYPIIWPEYANTTTAVSNVNKILYYIAYKEYFYCVCRVHGSALHGGRCAACREAHTNVAAVSAYIPPGGGL